MSGIPTARYQTKRISANCGVDFAIALVHNGFSGSTKMPISDTSKRQTARIPAFNYSYAAMLNRKHCQLKRKNENILSIAVVHVVRNRGRHFK